ncbi:MAG: HypC/HybG/HupF family hydrogenase formation chaperone [Candidatus Hodarchaeota archaeon]
MCIAVPVKVLDIEDDYASVDYGGLKKRISIALVKDSVSVDDYVIVHAGCAIQRIDPEEARETLDIMQQMLDQ